MTRLSKDYRNLRAQKTETVSALDNYVIPTVPETDVVERKSIFIAQNKSNKLEGLETNDNRTYKRSNCILISNDSKSQNVLLAVEVHCDERDQRASYSTRNIIKETYWWK